jgi:hypothetical protein
MGIASGALGAAGKSMYFDIANMNSPPTVRNGRTERQSVCSASPSE